MVPLPYRIWEADLSRSTNLLQIIFRDRHDPLNYFSYGPTAIEKVNTLDPRFESRPGRATVVL